MFIISERMSKVEQTGLSSRELGKTSLTGGVQKVIQTSTGVLVAFLWVVLMVVSTGSVQLLERRIPDFELNAARCNPQRRNWQYNVVLNLKRYVLPCYICICNSVTSFISAIIDSNQ